TSPHSLPPFPTRRSSDLEVNLVAVAHPSDAVRQADIVVSSIPPTDAPPIDAAHFKPGAVYIPLDLLNAWQDNVLTHDTVVVADRSEEHTSELQSRENLVC